MHLFVSLTVTGQRSLTLTTVLYCDCDKQWNCSVSTKYKLHGAQSLQKLIVTRLAKKFLFNGTRRSITVFRRTRYLSTSWGKLIQPVPSYPVFKMHFNIIRPSTPRCSTRYYEHKPKNVTFNKNCSAAVVKAAAAMVCECKEFRTAVFERTAPQLIVSWFSSAHE